MNANLQKASHSTQAWFNTQADLRANYRLAYQIATSQIAQKQKELEQERQELGLLIHKHKILSKNTQAYNAGKAEQIAIKRNLCKVRVNELKNHLQRLKKARHELTTDLHLSESKLQTPFNK